MVKMSSVGLLFGCAAAIVARCCRASAGIQLTAVRFSRFCSPDFLRGADNSSPPLRCSRSPDNPCSSRGGQAMAPAAIHVKRRHWAGVRALPDPRRSRAGRRAARARPNSSFTFPMEEPAAKAADGRTRTCRPPRSRWRGTRSIEPQRGQTICGESAMGAERHNVGG
jgi:hypothetical protein